MQKLTKAEFAGLLKKNPADATENDLRFIFNVMGFDLKEMKYSEKDISFEIHWRRYYIMGVHITPEILSFGSQWIAFNEDTQARDMAFECPSTVTGFISLFFGTFGSALLTPIEYNPGHVPGWSCLETPAEGREYWNVIADAMNELHPGSIETRDSKPAPEAPAPKRPNSSKKHKIFS